MESALRPDPPAVSAPGPMVPERFRVTDKRRETADTWTLELEPLDRHGDFEFLPGQFNMLYAFGAGEVPISISGDPEPAAAARAHRQGGGRRERRDLPHGAGDVLGVRGPFGSHWPTAKAVRPGRGDRRRRHRPRAAAPGRLRGAE